MRFSLSMVVGLALIASACGGGSGGTSGGTSGNLSGTPGGSSGGAPTSGGSATASGTTTGPQTTTGGVAGGTTGSSTGNASGGTGTGAANTGGTTGGLPAGSPCTNDAACASTICGVGGTGSGNCCLAACSTSDATCGATACGPAGACSYPVQGTACGSISCVGDQASTPSCDGAGTCAPATGPCPGNTLCVGDGTGCLPSCQSSADCLSGFSCNAEACVIPAATGSCTENDDCTSSVCGLDGGGNCCTAACAPTDDPVCSPVACDAASGDCVYPQGATCGTFVCTGSNGGAGVCAATGVCQPNLTACPNNLGCDDAGTTCNTSCAMLADCAGGFFCEADAGCVAQIAAGACTENDACASGICGIAGMGNCCASACSTDATCGASDCDATTAACNDATSGLACGTAVQSCTGSSSQAPSACDGAGNCSAPAAVDCSPYLCGATSCLTSCSDNTSCGAKDLCDVLNATCCSGLTLGGAIAVDSVTGSDTTACCGIGTNGACSTLTHAMTLIDAAQAQKVTINATVNGAGGDWAPAGEVYPMVLGWGVELNAPGVYFDDPASPGNAEIFDIANFSANDTIGYASIAGTNQANQVWIGMDTLGDQSADLSAIQVEANNILYIANTTVNGSLAAQSAAITLTGGATMAVGTDESSGITGTVNVGSPGLTDGWTGIACLTTNGQGCQIVDVQLAASTITIQGQENVDIDAEDYANITLTSTPTIGVAPTGGFLTCPSKSDALSSGGEAVLLHGQAIVSFSNGTVQCISGNGFELLRSGGNIPTLTLANSTIQNTELGIYALAGTASVSSSTIQFNYNGVEQDTDGTLSGTVDLSGGTSGGVNTVVCSSDTESIHAGGSSLDPGVCVLNTTSANLNASNVDWDTAGPDLFSCDSTQTTCTCEIANCTNAGGVDGMDAVYDSTGTVTTTGSAQSAIKCGG